ncbi:MAG: ABC transporter permease [Leptolyngbyaceae cyanobacterium SM2_3_12]|nr:ABC transporter permease [Leptolyngbyaceae cyanobacterium SM2_3_12]
MPFSLRQRLQPFTPLVGLLIALGLGGLLIALNGVNPLLAYGQLIQGAFGGTRQITETLLKATPILIIALGLTVAFRARVWNIGAEGQYHLGALLGGAIALWFPALPGILLIPLMLAGGMVGGLAWSGLAGLLHLKRGVNLIICTLMLNYIGILLVQYAARVPLQDPNGFLPESAKFVEAARLPRLFDSRLHIGILIALLLVVGVYVLLWRTSLGFRLRAVGAKLSVAKSVGIDTQRHILIALLISGAMAGLAGAIEVSYTYTRLKQNISDGYGFTAILVALLGQLNPLGVLVAAVLFSALSVGAQALNVSLQVPVAVAGVLQALLVLGVLAAGAIRSQNQASS